MTPFGVVNQYSDSLSQSGSMNGDIYTSEDNSRILEMDFSGGLAGGEATVTFSRFNEDVFGAGGIMAKPASASPVTPYRSSTPSYSTPTTPSSRKYLSSISPSSAPNTGSVKVEVSGSGFTSSTMVSLVMSGAPTITGVASAVSPYKMTCTFNLGGSMPGEYKVYLDNSPSYETFFVEGNNTPGSPTPTTTSPDWSPY